MIVPPEHHHARGFADVGTNIFYNLVYKLIRSFVNSAGSICTFVKAICFHLLHRAHAQCDFGVNALIDLHFIMLFFPQAPAEASFNWTCCSAVQVCTWPTLIWMFHAPLHFADPCPFVPDRTPCVGMSNTRIVLMIYIFWTFLNNVFPLKGILSKSWSQIYVKAWNGWQRRFLGFVQEMRRSLICFKTKV